MKTKRNFTIVLTALLAIALISTVAWAKKPQPAPVCGGLTGTWLGEEPGDMKWLAIHTSDSLDPAKGEMLINWIYVKPNLIGDGITLTPGHGVWKLNADGDYDYTWYAYALDSQGNIAYIIRVSGVAMFKDPYDPEAAEDCNKVLIYYEFEFATGDGTIDELSTASFFAGPTGGAWETRVPLIETPLPPMD